MHVPNASAVTKPELELKLHMLGVVLLRVVDNPEVAEAVTVVVPLTSKVVEPVVDID